ncbi:hypothetical protein DRN86_05275 [Candidatus Geothermarchaeota archaeon]|nr:MAG: hypothetical protein DRN86_05275 [Candidatus Geothermarchaeota archaeon]
MKKVVVFASLALLMILTSFYAIDLIINVQVSSPPSIQNVTLYSDDNGGTTTSVNSLTPNDEMTLYFEIYDADIADGDSITSITVEFYYQTKPQSTSPDLYVKYTWDGTSWSLDDGVTNSEYADYKWGLDTENTSVTVDTINSIYVVKLVFTPSKIAVYNDTSSWNIEIKAVDSTNQEGTTTVSYNCAFYVEYVSINPSSVSILIAPDGQAHLISDSPVTITIISNANYSLKMGSPGWYNETNDLVYDLTEISIYVDDDDLFNGDEYQVTVSDPTLASPFGSYTRTYWDTVNGAPVSSQPSLYIFIVASTSVQPGKYHTTLSIIASV